jgi:hypothetical protein
LDRCGRLFVLALGFVERRLRLADGALPTFTILLPDGLLPRPVALAVLLPPRS